MFFIYKFYSSDNYLQIVYVYRGVQKWAPPQQQHLNQDNSDMADIDIFTTQAPDCDDA